MPARAFSASRPTGGILSKSCSRSEQPSVDGRSRRDFTMLSGECEGQPGAPFEGTKVSEKNPRQQSRAIPASITALPQADGKGARNQSDADPSSRRGRPTEVSQRPSPRTLLLPVIRLHERSVVCIFRMKDAHRARGADHRSSHLAQRRLPVAAGSDAPIRTLYALQDEPTMKGNWSASWCCLCSHASLTTWQS
jgi:hypothetical protein